jgi:hypothetical protein
MKTIRSRLLAAGFGAMCLTVLFACAVSGYGGDYGDGVGYVGGYYEPYGYDYGGWGGSYWVGPGRCCEGGRDGRGGDRGGGYHGGYRGGDRGGHAPPYRAAPGGRAAPSIPSRSRGH